MVLHGRIVMFSPSVHRMGLRQFDFEMSLISHVKGLGIENDSCIRIERIFEEKKKNLGNENESYIAC